MGIKLLVLGKIFVILLASFLISATYYVDKDSIGGTCSDAGAGTLITAPWCTIGKTIGNVNPGDTIYIRAGTYQETFSGLGSGTSGNPITFARYQSEEVIVDGAETVTGWSVYSGNVYQATISYAPSPKFTDAMYGCSYGGGLILQDGAKLNYCMAQNLAAVDTAGEYYINDSGSPPYTLYVYLRDIGGKGYDPTAYAMKVQKLNVGAPLSSASYLTFDGLTIRNFQGAFTTTGGTDLTVRNCKIHTHQVTGIYQFSAGNNLLAELNEFWDCGHAGIEFEDSTYPIVRRNLFKKVDLGNGLGGNSAHISYNLTPHTFNNAQIINNVFWETGGSYLGDAWSLRIAGNNNQILHNTFYRGSTAMLYTIGMIDGASLTVKNNIVYDTGTPGGRSPSIIDVQAAAVSDGGHAISNNVFYTTLPTAKFRWNGTNYDSLAAWESASGQSGNLSGDPLFVNLSSRNFILTSLSPAINAGANVGVVIDYAGNLRPQGGGYDIGGYEYVLSGFLGLTIQGGSLK